MRGGRLCMALLGVVLGSGCVVREIKEAPGLGSFKVELLAIGAYPKQPGCENAPDRGTRACPRPFPSQGAPAVVRLRAQALDRKGKPLAWNGLAQVDVRPGAVEGVGPAGMVLAFTDGISAEIDVPIIHASGPTRIWIEDCGSPSQPGSFATGVSAELNFENPRIDQLQITHDNTTGPVEPRADNVCAIAGDPRYGLGVNEDGQVEFVGYSAGRSVNVPPPAIGTFLEIEGCTRAEYDAALAEGGSCRRGPLVVTAIDNAGFFVTDIHPNSVKRGFNSIYLFNFNYPDNLEVGDIVVSLKGAPAEFAGTTQLRNPAWRRDGVGRGRDLLPAPIHLTEQLIDESIRTYGRNNNEALEIESLEGSVVCVDNIAPTSEPRNCDLNNSGRIEREGCLVSVLPLRCEIGVELAPAPPTCDQASLRPFCLDLTETEVKACALEGYLPASPGEYCCERVCYNDYACTESSSYVAFGQWAGDVRGHYEQPPAGGDPLKIAFITRDADPDFDPFAFGAAQRAKPAEERQHLRIVGTLVHVVAARPVWVVEARGPSDIAVMEESGGCDALAP